MGDVTERGLAVQEERSVAEVKAQVSKIQSLMTDLMHEGEHYGASFPGDTKKNLLKPGADKLCFIFRLSPEFEVKQIDLPKEHREVQVKTTLRNLATDQIVGQGLGSCSTMESKYRWRNEARKCPACGRESIIKGKAEYGGGWVCFKKKDGCGAKFNDGDPTIESQQVGKVENPDIADVYNTVLKIAKKRSYVDATITATAASDIFTQDAEDFLPETKHETTRPAEDASAEYGDEGRSSLDAAAENGTLFDDRPAQKSATAKPKTTERAPTEPASFSSFVEALNTAVPSKDRASWMQKANGGKDGALLAKLIEEIRATYPQGATGSAPSGNLRIVAMEYIGSVVPEPDRATLRADLEKTSDSEIAAFFGGLRDRYER